MNKFEEIKEEMIDDFYECLENGGIYLDDNDERVYIDGIDTKYTVEEFYYDNSLKYFHSVDGCLEIISEAIKLESERGNKDSDDIYLIPYNKNMHLLDIAFEYLFRELEVLNTLKELEKICKKFKKNK